MNRPFSKAQHQGYTHNPDAQHGLAHAVIELGGGKPPVLACGLYGHAMDHIKVHTEPQRPLCDKCAEYTRVWLLTYAHERFRTGRNFSDAEAAKFVRELADRAAFVIGAPS